MTTNMTTTDSNAKALEKPKQKEIKELLRSEDFKLQVAAALPKHLTPDRFIRVALTAMLKTPKIAQCSQNSLFKVLLDCSSLGLEPDGRRAHIIPYGNEATLIIDYKGLIELAKRSGEVVAWRAELVCENDHFEWDNGVVTHKINWLKDRGKTLAVYSHVRNKSGIDEYEVMTLAQVEAIRKRSKSGNNGPWVTDFDEMAKKTVIRRHSKKLTLSPEFNDAVTKDDEDFDIKKSVPDFNYEEMMPKRMSESEPVMIAEQVAETKEEPVKVNSVKENTTKIDPEAPISAASITLIMEAMKANSSFTRDTLMSYIKSVWNKTKLTELREKDAADVIKFIGKPPREPGCDDE